MVRNDNAPVWSAEGVDLLPAWGRGVGVMTTIDRIPQALRAEPRWVVWRSVTRGGKPTKAPFRPSGDPAKSTDPATWCSFEEALAASEVGRFDGIGFVLGDGWAGVDLDKARAGNEGPFDPWAQRIIDRLATYAEVSPSGRGVKLFLRGAKPGHRAKLTKVPDGGPGAAIEVYDAGRYFTVTGDRLADCPATVEQRSDELAELYAEWFGATPAGLDNGRPTAPTAPALPHDQDLLDTMFAARNGGDVRRLWEGDLSAYGDDHSSADLALCGHLAFYCGPNPAHIDRLFRQSGLYREKWDRQDYRERTIEHALAGRTEFYSPRGDRPERADRPAGGDPADEGGGRRGRSQAALLLDMAEEAGAEPFRETGGAFWLAAPEAGHIVAVPIGEKGGSGGVGRWLRRLWGERYNRPPSAQAVADAAAQLNARAEVGPVRAVHVRVAAAGGAVYLDLNRSDWHVAAVTADGWGVAPCPAGLHFRRPKDARPLADPRQAGDLAALFELLGDRIDRADAILVAAWLLGTLQPDAAYPILHLTGEAGAGKSSLARLLAETVDTAGANRDATVGAPRDEEALAVRAVTRHVVALDNLSGLQDTMSDAICRLSTGGPVSRRQLYTDFEEASVYLRRPVILTGIGDVATRGDLADRCLTVTLPPIGARRAEADLWHQADRLLPSILGGLLTAAAAALRCRDEVTGPLPRMADWAAWCLAATVGGAVPWTEDEFREALAGTREAAAGAVLGASPLPELLERLLEQEGGGPFERRPSDLLADLGQLADNTARARRDWPTDATRLSGALRQLAPALREAGRLDLTQRKSGSNRFWRIGRITATQGTLDLDRQRPTSVPNPTERPTSVPTQSRSATDTTANRDARDAESPISSVRERQEEREKEQEGSKKGANRSETRTSVPSVPDADFDPFDPDLPMNRRRDGEEV